MNSDLCVQLEQALGCRLTPIDHEMPHHNTHYKASSVSGEQFFVKVIDDHPSYYQAELRAQHHLAAADIPTPQIIGHGSLNRQQRWLAYEWHVLEPFVASSNNIRTAGRLLGRLHAATSGVRDQALRHYADLRTLVTQKTNLVAQIDMQLAQRIQALSDRLFVQPTTTRDARPSSLLHGDFGWRNIYLNADAELRLLDFEHAAIGHPLLDFAKLWDRELRDLSTRETFMLGYAQGTTGEPPAMDAIDAVRLWGAAGIIPYARPRHDTDFERQALEILTRLEQGE